MTERIFVTYSLAFGIPGIGITSKKNLPIRNPGTGAFIGDLSLPGLGTPRIDLGFHQTLNYIDGNGDHFVVEGFPAEEIDSTERRLAATFAEEIWLLGESNTDSPFGPIVTKIDRAKEGHLNRPSETIATGADLSVYWAAIKKAALDISGRYEYRPLSQNSNTFVSHALKEAGLQAATGKSDAGETFNAPGIYRTFKNPIPQAPDKDEHGAVDLPVTAPKQDAADVLDGSDAKYRRFKNEIGVNAAIATGKTVHADQSRRNVRLGLNPTVHRLLSGDRTALDPENGPFSPNLLRMLMGGKVPRVKGATRLHDIARPPANRIGR